MNIKNFAPLEKASNITLTALTNDEKVDENERNKKYNDENLTVENLIITNEVKIENQKSDVQSSNLVPNLLETSASEFSLLQSEKEINLIESPEDIPVPIKNKNSNAPTLSSSNLLDCSLPKQETLNLEMDKEAPRGKCPYHLSLINLINNIYLICIFESKQLKI